MSRKVNSVFTVLSPSFSTKVAKNAVSIWQICMKERNEEPKFELQWPTGKCKKFAKIRSPTVGKGLERVNMGEEGQKGGG